MHDIYFFRKYNTILYVISTDIVHDTAVHRPATGARFPRWRYTRSIGRKRFRAKFPEDCPRLRGVNPTSYMYRNLATLFNATTQGTRRHIPVHTLPRPQ